MSMPISSTSAALVRAITGPAGSDALAKLLSSDLGTSMRGTVIAVLSDGSSVVDIKGAAVRMQLPSTAQPNTTVDLKLMSTKPGLTFLLSDKVSISEAAAHQDPTLPVSASVGAQGAGVSISAAGKMVGALLSASVESNQALAVIGKTPVVGSPGSPASEIATGLKSTLEFSGVFYESHVGQWASQDRSIAQLQREPQMLASTAATPSTESTGSPLAASNAGVTAALPSPIAGDAAPADTGRVALQLHTLEHQSIEWRGDVWPGQSMRWDVQRDAAGAANSEESTQSTWQSTVTFNLPSLGEVQAKLYLSAGHVRMVLQADSEDTAVALRAASAELGQSLSDAGTELDAISVSIRQPGDTAK